MTDLKYKRIVLKLSGEALAGDQGFGIHPPVIKRSLKKLRMYLNWVFKLESSLAVAICGVASQVPDGYGTCTS